MMLYPLMVLFTAAILFSAPLQSTSSERKSVEVTVYNSDLGVVKDTRVIKLTGNEQEIRFMDVAAMIRPVTVQVRSISKPEGFAIIEQNYEYDLLSPERLLEKYVGRKLKLVSVNETKGTRETVQAELLSMNSGPIYRINNEIHVGYPGYQVLPELPDNLIARPTLSWLVRSDKAGEQTLEASYQTDGISWSADYVLTLSKDDNSASLSGWVTLDNRCGAAFDNAKLKLVAGNVNRIEEVPEYSRRSMKMMELGASMSADEGFREETLFEYHLYNLQRPTTIKDQQKKQINLLEAPAFPVQKELVLKGQSHYFQGRNGSPQKDKIEVMLVFKNEKKCGLGMPLPAGIIRTNKMDSQGSLEFIGEDRIGHTPENEEVTLKLGEAFDVSADRVQTDFAQVTDRRYESEWKITLRNHKKEKISVTLLEPVGANWKMLKNSMAYKKKDAFTLEFDVPVPADGTVEVTYRVSTGL